MKAVPSRIAVLSFFVVHISGVSSWQFLHHHKRSSSPSSFTAATVWSRYHQMLNQESSNELYIDVCNKRFTSMLIHFTHGFNVILFAAALISLSCIHPQASVAFADPLSTGNIFLTSAELPIHQAHRFHSWMFENGEVILPEKISANGLKFTSPRLLGSGGGGAVFVLSNEQLQNTESLIPDQVALKVSWKGSTKSVSNECNILRELQRESMEKYGRKIQTIETCFGEVSYEDETAARTMIILYPVFNDKQASSLQDFTNEPDKLLFSVTQIIQTMLQLLSHNVVTIDVQPLISRKTGQILFVDFTEATIVNTRNEKDDKEIVAIRNFIGEMIALIPESLNEDALSNIFHREREKYPIASEEVNNILSEYF